jgi:hypothetical protein
VKAAYQVAVDQGTDSTNTPDTFVLTPVLQNMVLELIKTSERYQFFFTDLFLARINYEKNQLNYPENFYKLI